MLELSESSAPAYLRQHGRASTEGELLVQSLSGGVANTVLKIFDPSAGPRIGSDTRTPDELHTGAPDLRPTAGDCFVLKQPLPRFKTQAEWLVDIDRALVERDALLFLQDLLPAGSVPAFRWFDDANYILAMDCAPPDARLWKSELLAGKTSTDAAIHAGMLLAMLHSGTARDPAIDQRFRDPKFFIQQRIDPYFRAASAKNPAAAGPLERLSTQLLSLGQCLIHGDFSPKNILLIQKLESADRHLASVSRPLLPTLDHLMLLDFEVAFYGHPAFDVATLINHLLLKAAYHTDHWRPFMVMIDTFWQTYEASADPTLRNAVEALVGTTLGGLLLARIDGKSPAEYLLDNEPVRDALRAAACDILTLPSPSLDDALDRVVKIFS